MSDIRREEEPHALRLDLPAAHSAGRMARQMVRQFAISEGVPAREIDTLEFVAGELLDNAVDHGGGNAAMDESDLERDVRMTLRLSLDNGSWRLEVADQGGGLPDDVRALLEPSDDLPDLEDERGRGFFLLKQMVDRIEVDRSDDGLGLSFRALRSYAG